MTTLTQVPEWLSLHTAHMFYDGTESYTSLQAIYLDLVASATHCPAVRKRGRRQLLSPLILFRDVPDDATVDVFRDAIIDKSGHGRNWYDVKVHRGDLRRFAALEFEFPHADGENVEPGPSRGISQGKKSAEIVSEVEAKGKQLQNVRRGPKRGTTGYAIADEALFPEIERLTNSGRAKSAYDAAMQLGARISGGGTPESKAKRLSQRYLKWQKHTENS